MLSLILTINYTTRLKGRANILNVVNNLKLLQPLQDSWKQSSKLEHSYLADHHKRLVPLKALYREICSTVHNRQGPYAIQRLSDLWVCRYSLGPIYPSWHSEFRSGAKKICPICHKQLPKDKQCNIDVAKAKLPITCRKTS